MPISFRCFMEDTESDDDLSLFFKFEKEVYGADEGSRLIFAQMKNPDKENPKSWKKDASFSAKNMETGSERIFGYKDLDRIKIIDEKDVPNKR